MSLRSTLCVAFVGTAAALEPFVPPIAIQTSQQASLPNTITVNYDVPHSGLTKELEALKSASFLAKTPRTDVFYENPSSPADYEAEYQKILGQVCGSIKAKFQNMNYHSFMEELAPAREPTVKIFVDSHARGKDIDLARLQADAYACGSKLMASSFLGAHGDEIPRPLPVLNVDIPVRQYISAGELSAIKGSLDEIRSLSK